MNFFTDNIYIISLFPLWICFVILSGIFFKITENNKITYILSLLSSVIGLFFSIAALIYIVTPQQMVIEHAIEWLRAGDIHISAGTIVDINSAVLLIILFSAALFIQIYSGKKLENSNKYNVFFALVNFLCFSLSGLILSPNFFQFFIFDIISFAALCTCNTLYFNNNNYQKTIWANYTAEISLFTGIFIFSYISAYYINALQSDFLAFSGLDIFNFQLQGITYPNIYTSILLLFIFYIAIRVLLIPFQQLYYALVQKREYLLYLFILLMSLISGLYLLLRINILLNGMLLTSIFIIGIILIMIFIIGEVLNKKANNLFVAISDKISKLSQMIRFIPDVIFAKSNKNDLNRKRISIPKLVLAYSLYIIVFIFIAVYLHSIFLGSL